METKTLAIIGSGPAAHTAAIYSSRAGIHTILFEGDYSESWTAGGQLMNTTEVENFPGFPDGVTGPEFCFALRDQSSKFGTEIRSETVIQIQPRSPEEGFTIVSNKGQKQIVQAVVIATGATAKTLNVPGKDEFWNKGISACAVCDGALPMFRERTLVVVGGGDSACEEANFLTRFASKVVLAVRSGAMRASKIMQQRVLNNPKIQILFNTELVRVLGTKTLEAVELINRDMFTYRLDCAGLFFAIGHKPNTDFLGDLIELDADGYIITNGTQTSRQGIFAAGDVQDKVYRQAITAAGSGCSAALDAIHYLEEHF